MTGDHPQQYQLAKTVIRDHAREQIIVRQISDEQIRLVLSEPDEVIEVRAGRVVAQRMIAIEQADDEGPKQYLFRVVVDVDRNPPELVTVYRTSKIRKYRSRP